MYKRYFRNDKIAIDKSPLTVQKNEFEELPSIWKKNSRQLQGHGNKNDTQNCFFALQIDRVCNLLLPKTNHNLGQLISQAIFSHSDKRLSVAGIKDWFKTSTHVLPTTKEIKNCLFSNNYFKQVKLNHHTYWKVDELALSKQPFGQYILDTGVIGGFEYWNGSRHYI